MIVLLIAKKVRAVLWIWCKKKSSIFQFLTMCVRSIQAPALWSQEWLTNVVTLFSVISFVSSLASIHARGIF